MSGRPLSYTKEEARQAIEASFSWAETLRRLGLCPTGGAWLVIQKHAAEWGISSDHFRRHGRPRIPRRSLEEMLVENSPVRGTKLKERLYREGLKARICELCGQGEDWNGRHMSLILDHINGVRDDNRLENLRIVCANCNATLETHCGRQTRIVREPRQCVRCGASFVPRYDDQVHCSQYCGSRHTNRHVPPRHAPRPPLDDLLTGVATVGYEAVGRAHGVSGNAVRKWIKAHGVDPPPGRGRSRLMPPPPPHPLGDENAARALALLADGKSMYAVAKLLGVDRNTIRDLRRGDTYKHLERPAALREAA